MPSLLLISSFLFLSSILNTANATGSTTFLTNNGFPINFLQSIVESPVVQEKLKRRWKWEVWDVVPGTHAYQIYVFNITNPSDVETGGKPLLQQLGPYYYKQDLIFIYRERRYKFEVSVNLDLTVNFERNYTYTFVPSQSEGKEEDLVNVLNLPFIIFSYVAAETDPSAANAAVKALTASGETLVKKNVKVGDLLYHGMDVTKYKEYMRLFGDPKDNDLADEFLSGQYGIMRLKAGSHEKPYVVDSGLLDENNVGKIVEWNSKKQLSWWSGDSCNAINGTDASVFPPSLRSSQQLTFFDLDLCRSVTMDYSNDMVFKAVIVGLHYKMSSTVLEDPAVYEPNSCFCKTPETCLKKGLIDVSKCHFGAPLVMSNPHFLEASPEYSEAVSGLNPSPSLHLTQADVEPITGAVISFQKRYQWNIRLRPLPQIDYFKNMKPLIFPVIWNDDVFHLNPDKAQLLLEELASQMGGSGEAASDLVNRLGGISSSQSSSLKTNLSYWHALNGLLMGIVVYTTKCFIMN